MKHYENNRFLKRKFFVVILIVFGLTNLSAQNVQRFSDSQTFVKAGRYKINVVQKNSEEFSTVYFKMYKKSKSSWIKIQDGNFRKESSFPLSVDTSEDLNNDGYGDVKISYAQAGRGSNSIEKVFMFDPRKQQLVEIINSQEYPNLHYNPGRNCLNSYAFYGGTSTYFLKIKKNRLEEFGRVDYANDTVQSFKIINDKEILLQKRPYKSTDAAVFFSDFDPLKE